MERVLKFLQSANLYHLLMKGSIAVALIFLSLWWQGFAVFAIALLCLFVSIENNEKSLLYAFFMYGFRSFYIFAIKELWAGFGVDFFIGFLLIFHLIRYILFHYRKKQKLFIWPFIFLMLFLFHMLMPYGTVSVTGAMSHFFILLFILVFILYFKSIDLRELTIMFSVGLILSCAFGLVMLWADVFPFPKYYFGTAYRFSGALSNPNTLYMATLVSIFPLLFLFLHNRIGYEFYPLFVTVSIAGIFTMSRFWILVYLCTLVVFAVWYVLKNYRKKMLRIGIVAILLLCITIAFFPYIRENLYRLTNLGEEFLVVDEGHDPGRVGRWNDAFNEWTESPKTIIFGVGIGKDAKWPEHNFYLFILRRTGIIGGLLVLSLFISLYYFLNGKRWKLKIGLSTFFLGLLVLNLVVESMFRTFIFSLFVTMVLLIMTNEQKNEIAKREKEG